MTQSKDTGDEYGRRQTSRQAPRFISRSLSLLNGSQRKSHASRPRHTPPNRVWNGIVAAGDWPAKKGPKTTSPRGDRKSETTTRREMAAKTAFLPRPVRQKPHIPPA